ncbi:hypothetical protein F4604DRAFT_1675109 [Suillus subluteus]|nr:hypothetical protein F4604DRAFT_1675109 [Suillus subluteus]
MSLTNQPPAKEAVQFDDRALHLSMRPRSPMLLISSDEQHPGIAHDKDAVHVKSGCYTCRIRQKKCDKQPNADGSYQTCLCLCLQCLGFGTKCPEWLHASNKDVDH